MSFGEWVWTGFVCACVALIVAPIACLTGAKQVQRAHCEAQGYPEFTVDDKGRITCVKVTKEAVP